MTQTSKINVPVVTFDHDGALVSGIFASRQGLVNTAKLDHETGKACLATIVGLEPGDYVLRSVRSGKRRSIQVLAGSVSVAMARTFPGFAPIVDNQCIVPAHAVSDCGQVDEAKLQERAQFTVGDVIVLTDGDALSEIAGAIRVH